MRKHVPCLVPLCAPQFVRDGTHAVIQERGENGNKCELHYSVAEGVGQGSTLSSATFSLELLEPDDRSDGASKQRKTCGFNLVRRFDFIVSTDGDEADRIWERDDWCTG